MEDVDQLKTAERTWEAVERARAEAALRASEALLRQAATATGLGVFEWDLATDRLTVSEQFRMMFGLPAHQHLHVGVMMAAQVHADDRRMVDARIAAAFDPASGGRYEVEHRASTPQGLRWFRASGQVYFAGPGADARPVRVVGFVQDVTERRQAEELASGQRFLAEREVVGRELAAAEEAERGRLARELHDQLGQQLTAFALGMEDALRLVATQGTPVGATASEVAALPLARRLTQLHTLAREMQAGARYLALELRPPELDDVGFESALATYLREWSARYAIPAELAIAGAAADSALSAELGSTLYRIAQEALTNVAKHAGAASVSVIVEKRDGAGRFTEVRLIVEDDGRGFDPAAVAERVRRERRVGLLGMRERAALVGGTLEVESRPDGGGTTIYVRVPVVEE